MCKFRNLHQLAASMRRLILRIFGIPRRMQTSPDARVRQKRPDLWFVSVKLITVYKIDSKKPEFLVKKHREHTSGTSDRRIYGARPPRVVAVDEVGCVSPRVGALRYG